MAKPNTTPTDWSPTSGADSGGEADMADRIDNPEGPQKLGYTSTDSNAMYTRGRSASSLKINRAGISKGD